MISSWLRLVVFSITALLFFISGLPLLPFGKAGRYYRWISGLFGKVLLKICGGKPEFIGLDNLDPSKSYVFVGNHQSYVDIFLVESALYKHNMRTLFMVKEELYKIPLFKTVTKQMGLIPITRENSKKAMQAVIDAIKTVDGGYSIVIFAEGTRSTDMNILPFKRGAFMLAEKSGKSIVPFALSGTGYILPKNKLKMTAGACRISFMSPINPVDISSKELLAKVENIVKERYISDKAQMDIKWKKQ